jgi:3-methyl-2-oxobutanoate hydroxymethyltransferase
MKRDRKPIVGVVVYDYQGAQIADRAGADIVSLGDSVGHTYLGHENQDAITIDELLMFARAVRRGVKNALFSCDMPFGSYQVSDEDAVRNAIRLVKEGGADCVKVEVRRAQAHLVEAIARAGIPVFAQFGITPQTSAHVGGWESGAQVIEADLVETARAVEAAGASMIDLTRGGAATRAVTEAVHIPVIGGIGSDERCDGHIRTLFRMAGMGANTLDSSERQPYGHSAKVLFDSITAYAGDIRSGKVPRAPAPSVAP